MGPLLMTAAAALSVLALVGALRRVVGRLTGATPLTWTLKRAIGGIASQVLPIRTPRVVSGEGCLSEVGKTLRQLKVRKPLIVTSPSQVKYGAVKTCLAALAAEGMEAELFDTVTPDPHSELVEQGYAVYQTGGCDSIIALGGGSPMDCAKVIGAKVANPKAVRRYEGFLNVTLLGLLGRVPPLIAVPTTAGSGAETTLAAVITLQAERRKITVADTELVPRVAILDPRLLKDLPPPVTAATGMDALTHAIESFLSGWKTDFTARHSLTAVEKIFRHLTAAYHDGGNMVARSAMLLGSFEAGVAFGRASVGYVHAIAHQFGAMFHTPHGAANAMLLPLILEFYLRDLDDSGDVVLHRLCELAVAAGLASCEEVLDVAARPGVASRLPTRLRGMISEMSVPRSVAQMRAGDVREVATRALKEAHGELHSRGLRYALDLGYPVPKYMTLAECEEIVSQCLSPEESQVWKAGTEQ